MELLGYPEMPETKPSKISKPLGEYKMRQVEFMKKVNEFVQVIRKDFRNLKVTEGKMTACISIQGPESRHWEVTLRLNCFEVLSIDMGDAGYLSANLEGFYRHLWLQALEKDRTASGL